MFIRLQQANPSEGVGGSPAPTPTPSPTPAPTPTPSPTVLNSGNMEWLSDKYHVKTADGKIDEAASIRKQAEAYSPLAKRMVDIGLPPEKPEAYKVELPADVKDVNVEEFTKDPKTQSFLKDAHAKGMTNDQVNFVLGRYAQLMPEIGQASAEITTEQATEQLKTVWKTDAEFKQNASSAYRASSSLATVAGIKYDDIEAAGLGNNPVFLRLMAALGKEMGEDVPVTGDAPGGAGTFDEQTQSLRKELDAMPLHDAKRKGVQEKLDQLYTRKYGTQRTGFTTLKSAAAK